MRDVIFGSVPNPPPVDIAEIALTFLLLIFYIPLCRTVTTFIHELGHGLAALSVSKNPVTLYIGTYGEKEGTMRYGIGRLRFVHRFSLLNSRGGLCSGGPYSSTNATIFMILMGPVSSALAGSAVVVASLAFNWSSLGQTLAFVFCASTLYDLIYNLTPDPTPIGLPDGTITFRDGMLIKQQLMWQRMPERVRQLLEEKVTDRVKQVAELEETYTEFPAYHDYLRAHLLNGYIGLSDWQRGLDFYQRNEPFPEPLYDYIALPVFQSMSGDHAVALETTDRLLTAHPDQAHLLLNRSYILNIAGRFAEARSAAEALLDREGIKAFAHSNLAYALAHLGETELAKEHAQQSLEMDSENSYAQLALGITHRMEGDETAAKEAFGKAHALNPYTFGLAAYYSGAAK